MKSVELFCASPASTAICSSMDQRSMVRRGIKPMDHRLAGGRPKTRSTRVPCSSQIPFSPRPYNYDKNRKTSSAKQSHDQLRRKSSADIRDWDLSSPPGSSRYLLSDNPNFDLLSLPDSEHSSARVPTQSDSEVRNIKQLKLNDFPVFRSSSTPSYESPVYQSPSVRSTDLHSHKSSLSRSNNTHVYKRSNDSPAYVSSPTFRTDSPADKSSPLLRSDSHAYKSPLALAYTNTKDSHTYKSPSALTCTKDSPTYKSSTTRSPDEIVELKVSIHCKGCEGKVRKHISRMEGVKSYSIDQATKKVTIVGNVTPLGVLTSISKVKYAEFWAPSTSSSSSSSPSVSKAS